MKRLALVVSLLAAMCGAAGCRTRAPLMVAHRGAGDLEMPEASLAAYSNAVATACDIVSIEEAMHAYRAKAAEMQAALDAMVPDAEATPEEQRNYYSARRMPVERKVKKTIQECEGWICNLCGCLHNKPQECAEPELGGRWIYKTYTVEEIVKTYELHE